MEADQPEEPVQSIAALIRILKITRPEWFYIFVAAISSVVIGASFPGFSILFGEFYGVGIFNFRYTRTFLFCILVLNRREFVNVYVL